MPALTYGGLFHNVNINMDHIEEFKLGCAELRELYLAGDISEDWFRTQCLELRSRITLEEWLDIVTWLAVRERF